MRWSLPMLWQRLEGESRRTLLGFALKLAFVLPIVLAGQHPAAAARSVALIYALWSIAFAALHRQRVNGPNLNLWDEALWFLALSHLAGALPGRTVGL